MRGAPGLGEFEQLVLLAILQLGSAAHAPGIRTAIEEAASRAVTRGALYTTLERLETKGYLRWRPEPGPPVRGGIPRRCFVLTAAGLGAVRRARAAVANLSRGLDGQLGSA